MLLSARCEFEPEEVHVSELSPEGIHSSTFGFDLNRGNMSQEKRASLENRITIKINNQTNEKGENEKQATHNQSQPDTKQYVLVPSLEGENR